MNNRYIPHLESLEDRTAPTVAPVPTLPESALGLAAHVRVQNDVSNSLSDLLAQDTAAALHPASTEHTETPGEPSYCVESTESGMLHVTFQNLPAEAVLSVHTTTGDYEVTLLEGTSEFDLFAETTKEAILIIEGEETALSLEPDGSKHELHVVHEEEHENTEHARHEYEEQLELSIQREELEEIATHKRHLEHGRHLIDESIVEAGHIHHHEHNHIHEHVHKHEHPYHPPHHEHEEHEHEPSFQEVIEETNELQLEYLEARNHHHPDAVETARRLYRQIERERERIAERQEENPPEIDPRHATYLEGRLDYLRQIENDIPQQIRAEVQNEHRQQPHGHNDHANGHHHGQRVRNHNGHNQHQPRHSPTPHAAPPQPGGGGGE